MRRGYILLIKIVISIIFLYMIFYKYGNYEEMRYCLGKLNYPILFGVLLFSFFTRIANAFQLKICLAELQISHPLLKVFNAQQIAGFYSFIVPGDLVAGGMTWHLLSKNTGARIIVASGLFFIKILNLTTLFFLAVFSLHSEPKLDEYHLDSYVFLLGITLLIFILPFFWKPFYYYIEKNINKIYFLKRFSKASAMLEKIFASVRLFHQIRFSMNSRIIFLAVVTQMLSIVALWLSIKAVNIDAPFIICFWILPLITLIHLLPITIAGTGFREISIIFFLNELYGVSSEQSLLLSFIILLSGLFFGAWGGVLHLIKRI